MLINTTQAAAILGLSRSRMNRVGKSIKRKRRIINGRACWMYDKDEVRNHVCNKGGRPRNIKQRTPDQVTVECDQP